MEYSVEKTDLRVQKTLNALIGALMELMKEKSLDNISVKEICDRAMVRKATFYNHFTNKYDLFSYIIRKHMKFSEESGIVNYDSENPEKYYEDIFCFLMDFLEINGQMMTQTLKSASAYAAANLYLDQMQPVIFNRLTAEMKAGNEKITSPDLLSGLISGAILQGAQYWFLNRKNISKKEAQKQFITLIAPLFE